eukprot:3060951-Amphidinium_carterae.1
MVHADANYWMDLQILKGLSGQVGAESLYVRFKNLLPSAKVACDLKQTWWASETTQGHLIAGVSVLNELMHGIVPVMPESPPEFLTSVMSALPHFLKVKLTGAENEARGFKKEPCVLSGLEALTYKWSELKGKDAKSLKLPQLEELTAYSWLLSEEDNAILTDMVSRKHEELSVIKVAGDKKRSANMSESKPSKKSKASAGNDAKKCAAALFE